MIAIFITAGYIVMYFGFCIVPFMMIYIAINSSYFDYDPPVYKKPQMPKTIEPDMDTVLSILAHRAHMEERGL